MAGCYAKVRAALAGLADQDFLKTYVHPDLGLVPLDEAVAMYAWHGRHHVAHITSTRERLGW